MCMHVLSVCVWGGGGGLSVADTCGGTGYSTPDCPHDTYTARAMELLSPSLSHFSQARGR